MDVQAHSRALRNEGWTLIEDIENSEQAADCLSEFGKILPQYDGQPCAQVKATPDYSNLPVSGSTGEIGPHTDGIALQQPPEFLALYCVQPARCGGGYTNLADGFDIISSLDDEAASFCRNERFSFSTAGGLLDEESHNAEHAIFEEDKLRGGSRINFSHNYFRWGDLNPVAGEQKFVNQGILTRVLDVVERLFEDTKRPFLIPEKGLLIWDNGRLLHSRGTFKDPSRHLIRYWLS